MTRPFGYKVASDDASYITGSDFMVDGGLSACYVVSQLDVFMTFGETEFPDDGVDLAQTPEGEPLLPPPSSMILPQ
jgi:hypothetical protein